MDSAERLRLTEQSYTLRADLKAWEKSFAASNDGKKASNSDIKGHPEIAAKYKEYNKVRDILSGKIRNPQAPLGQTPRKRKHDDASNVVPSKRLQLTETPSKTPSRGPIRPWEVDPYDSPSIVRSLFTPSKKSLGPTPQKDGLVLGLFDLLEDGSGSKKEAVKTKTTDVPVGSTPRKPKGDIFETIRHSKTPTSAGKRFVLDSFATPLKNRALNGVGATTPSTVSKLEWSTPSFLRRDSSRIQLYGPVDGELGIDISPQKARLPRKPLVRGLSSMLAGLRQIAEEAAEEAADDDLDALHEMEDEAAGIKPPPKPKPPRETVLVEDSQPRDSQPNFPLGGFDDEADYDSDPGDQDKNLGPNGQPLRVYKKKGQKRTTRRVKMKPTKLKPAPLPTQQEESEDELSGDAILDTQIDDTAAFGEGRNFDSDTQSEYTASEGGTRYRRPNQSKNKSKSANKDGKIKTAARKVTALASQNFKRLKLRNSGAKGGPAHNSRFKRKK